MNEIPIQKITQIIGELYLENRLGEEQRRIAVEREQALAEQVTVLEARISNIEVKKSGKKD